MGRVLTLEESERYALRRRLIHLLREDRRYRHIVLQDLRPVWKFTGWSGGSSLPPSWRQVTHAYRQNRDGRVNAYVDVIRSYVGRFGFFDGRDRDGNPRPAAWVAEYVHADVAESSRVGGPLDPGSGAVYGSETFNLTVTVSPAGATFTSSVLGLSRDSPLQEKSDGQIGPDIGFSFEDWDAVRAQLHKMVEEWADAGERRFQEVYPHRNAASLQLWADSVEILFRHLYHGGPIPDRAERELVRRVAGFLPMTFPAPAQKSN